MVLLMHLKTSKLPSWAENHLEKKWFSTLMLFSKLGKVLINSISELVENSAQLTVASDSIFTHEELSVSAQGCVRTNQSTRWGETTSSTCRSLSWFQHTKINISLWQFATKLPDIAQKIPSLKVFFSSDNLNIQILTYKQILTLFCKNTDLRQATDVLFLSYIRFNSALRFTNKSNRLTWSVAKFRAMLNLIFFLKRHSPWTYFSGKNTIDTSQA